MTRVLSGIQPSGAMHLGNYFGAIKNFVREQDHADAFYCVVDLHALTQNIDPESLRKASLDLMAIYLASGLDPERCTLFLQSHVAEHTQLAWLLECTASMGELRRMTQFKDKAGDQEGTRVGLFTYPVLMAADIVLYDVDRVPVGDDQRQHLELTRDLAQRFNHRFGDVFVIPEASIPSVGARVMDLQEPTRKMSKSVSSPLGTVNMLDDPSDIERKIKKAVTDTDGELRYDPETKPGLATLLSLLAACEGVSPATIAQRYERYGDLKKDVAAALIAELAPIQQRYEEFRNDPAALEAMMAVGAQKARSVAARTYQRAADAIGLAPPLAH
jgi:tryptophanyl-tRNA synthetase